MAEALALSRRVLEALAASIDAKKAVFAGSVRRCRRTIGDLDLLVPSKGGAEIVRALTRLPGVERVLALRATPREACSSREDGRWICAWCRRDLPCRWPIDRVTLRPPIRFPDG